MAFTTGDNNFGTAKWIVDATAGQGTHTTIAAALTAASSGQTIFIRPGTYTENLTLKAGVNLVAYTADAVTPNVTISGKCTFTAAGTVTISGIRLQTNSDYLLEITGASASIVNLYDCYLNCTNNTGINLSATSGVINIFDSKGDVGTTGIALFTAPGGGMDIRNCSFTNSGGTSTSSNWSGTGSASAFFSYFGIPLSTSGSTFGFTFFNCFLEVTTTAPITHNCTGSAPTILKCFVGGGANSAISIGAGASLNVYNCEISSTNTNAITGTGSLNCSLLDFIASSSTINATLSTTFVPLKVNQGGTGDSSVTAYAPICGGTTTTGALQSASTGLGTSGFILTSNGSSALPSFQAPAAISLSVVNKVFTSTGTYTPTSGMIYCVIECVGGGGGGAGCPAAGAGTVAAGGGGGGGGYARKASSAAAVGVSQAVTIGAGGAGGVGNSAGSDGTNTSLGTLCVAAGGGGGGNAGAAAVTSTGGGGAGNGSTGDLLVYGEVGGASFGAVVGASLAITGGAGGSSFFGGSGGAVATTSGAAQNNGNNGNNYGSGGGGAFSTAGGSSANGGTGSKGVVVITEFVLS